jgi:hypothetical protein
MENIVILVRAGVNINHVSTAGNNQNVLMIYLANKKPLILATVQFLIDSGNHVNQVDSELQNTMHYLFDNPSCNAAVVELLIAEGCNIN